MAIEWSEGIVVADLADEPALSDELNTLHDRLADADAGAAPSMVVSFEAVSYINSSNIAQLLRLRKRLSELGTEMVLAGVNGEIKEVLAITGLDRVFTITPDKLTALASLQLGDAGEEV
ncbi:MAG: STAS domain-containing protein [Planctomycetota bacterium]